MNLQSTLYCHPGRALLGITVRHMGAIRDPLGNLRSVEVGPGSARCTLQQRSFSQDHQAALGRDDSRDNSVNRVRP